MRFPEFGTPLDVGKKKGEILSVSKHARPSALTAIPVLTDNMCQLGAQASGTFGTTICSDRKATVWRAKNA
jgi:hypothetical protein